MIIPPPLLRALTSGFLIMFRSGTLPLPGTSCPLCGDGLERSPSPLRKFVIHCGHALVALMPSGLKLHKGGFRMRLVLQLMNLLWLRLRCSTPPLPRYLEPTSEYVLLGVLLDTCLAPLKMNMCGQKGSEGRRLHALKLRFTSLEMAACDLQRMLKHYMDTCQELSLRRWRKKVKTWHTSSAELYAYIRSVPPSKAVIVSTLEGSTNDPMKMFVALSSNWDKIESCPQPKAGEAAIEMLRDHYSRFLPRLRMDIHLTDKHVKEQLSFMKNSAPGLDRITQSISRPCH